MKEISLLSHVFMEWTDAPPADHSTAVELTKAVHDHRKKVIVAGLFVEKEVEGIIRHFMFPAGRASEQEAFFAGEILGTDAVSFTQKKRLLLSLVNQKGWLQGQVKSDFDKALKKVISLRNAFAHGSIIVRGSAAFLEYFEGTRQKPELTDEYWTSVEAAFSEVVKHLEVIKTAAGMSGSTK